MRIIHTSDIHLDSRLSARLAPDKARIRRRELLSNLERLFCEAERLCCDAMIIAGDLFDNEKVSQRALDTALDAIGGHPSVSVFYLPGNHEKGAILSSGRSLPKNLFVFAEEWSYFKAGDVVIAGRSTCSENMFESLDFEDGHTNIAVLHGELRDRSAAPDIIGLRDASDRNISYLALGHYHSFKSFRLNGGGAAVYSGTPEGRGFDECGECGFVLIDTAGVLKYEFIPFAKRHIRHLQANISGIISFSEVQALCLSALKEIPREDIVRLELVGYRPLELWLDTKALEEKFADRFFAFDLKNSTRLAINKESFRYDKSLKGEFIRLVASRTDLDELTKEKIIETGLNALIGEEI